MARPGGRTIFCRQDTAMSSRPYDIVLFGATGFTGGLVADYLAAASTREPLRWAIAGRNPRKLAEVLTRLEKVPGATPPTVLMADVEDPESLAELAAATTAVITTVGPYAQFGEPLVQACAEAGTHYVDLTGEPQFVWQMRERWHEVALRTGARIVNSCGFESIPPDIGTLYAINQLRNRIGAAAWDNMAKVTVMCGVEAGGGISGGTWHSAVGAMSQPRTFLASRPKKIKGDPVGGIARPLFREARWQRWAVAMPTIDPEVVKQSARLRGDYGHRFAYGHYLLSKRLWLIGAGVAGIAGIFSLAQFGPSREWLLKQKPQGEGPSDVARAKGWFRMHFIADADGNAVQCEVSGGDPGYGDTAKMLAEAGLCLALDRHLPRAAGVITPAAAMGEVLIPRLERAGILFSTVA
jgi:short subunit dehydrogenase-like uncharacterized protein